MAKLRAGKCGVRLPADPRGFFSSPIRLDRLAVHPSFSSTGTKVLYRGEKQPEREGDHLHPSSARV